MSIKYLAALAVSAAAFALRAGTVGDFEADLKADPCVYHPESGTWTLSSSLLGSAALNWGWRESRPVPEDYDGDQRTDFAVYDRASSNWYIRLSSTGGAATYQFGLDQGRPIPRDYDGDGKADLAVYRWLTGEWLIRNSSNLSVSHFQFGWSEGRPLAEDFDGDGKADPIIFHRDTGNWYFRLSSAGLVSLQFGWREARPVPRDYDGDGYPDLAVYHAAAGNWYIRLTSTGQTIVENWGWPEAEPVPEDYDGDGKCDLAVYHRRTGNWYIRQSTTGTLRLFAMGGPDYCPAESYHDGAIQNYVILAFGDSITYGMGSKKQDPRTGYPILLERVLEPLLGGHCITINEGDPGESTGDGKSRIRSVLRTYQPDLTLLMEGVNDTFFSQPNSTIESNLKSMINSCKADGSQVIISTLTPVIKSSYRDRTEQERRIESFNPRIPGIASSTGIQYVDNWAAITSKPNWQSTLIEQKTANHPNDAGYAIMRETWLKKIMESKLAGRYY